MQAAFSPSHVIPYFEHSADPVLQSRLFSYPDTHRHRLGTNYQQLPVNAPTVPIANFQRDGHATFASQGSRPNYPSSTQPLKYEGRKGTLEGHVRDYEREAKHETFLGGAWRDLSEITELDFEQPRALWNKVFDDTARDHYVSNVAGHLGNVRSGEIKSRQLAVYAAVNQGLSDRIAKAIGAPYVKPLSVKPAAEAERFKGYYGKSAKSSL